MEWLRAGIIWIVRYYLSVPVNGTMTWILPYALPPIVQIPEPLHHSNELLAFGLEYTVQTDRRQHGHFAHT
jgi:hypothetical protein